MADDQHDWDLGSDLAEPASEGRSAAQTIDNMRRAAILCLRDPLRKGNVIGLPAEGEVLITGDIHGCRENFERVVSFAALHLNPDRYLILHEIIHGGPKDEQGGCRSFELLEEAARLKTLYPRQVHILLANHDLAEMLGTELTKGPQHLSQAFSDGLQHAYGEQAIEVKEAYWEFWSNLPIAAKTQNGIFISHSIPGRRAIELFDFDIFDRPLVAEDYHRHSDLYELLWGRNQDLHTAEIFAEGVGAEILVMGHQPSEPGYKVPNHRQIILYSDDRLGRCMMVPTASPVSQAWLVRQIRWIAHLPQTPTPRRVFGE
ncbi:MAG: metallophosphoesterase [Phycisphaerae bacterium]|nr:metallophosphoesterase [Phycisphaerae bacterium]